MDQSWTERMSKVFYAWWEPGLRIYFITPTFQLMLADRKFERRIIFSLMFRALNLAINCINSKLELPQ